MVIRKVNAADDDEWLRMRIALWPECSAERDLDEMAEYRANPKMAVLVADRGDGRLGGFLELAERSVAEGCDSSPVAYIEGWYVDPDLRRTGVGRALVMAAERFAKDAGHVEIASDCEINNDVSYLAHRAIGYEEYNRAIHLRKRLK